MGICSTQQKTQNLQKTESFGDLICEKKRKSHWQQIPRKRKQLSPPKLYDYTNPHRQYNVLINGALFDVVNSMELSSERLSDKQ